MFLIGDYKIDNFMLIKILPFKSFHIFINILKITDFIVFANKYKILSSVLYQITSYCLYLFTCYPFGNELIFFNYWIFNNSLRKK